MFNSNEFSRAQDYRSQTLTENLTNAEAFQLFSCKLDAALAENKKLLLKELEAKKSTSFSKENSVDFKLEHHKERYNFLTDLQSDFESIDKYIDYGDVLNAKEIIKKAVLRIKDQKKVIRIADKYGGDVAKEYMDDPITESSEESQRLRQAETRAKRKRFDKRNYNNPFRADSKFFQQRFTPYTRQFGTYGNYGGPQSSPYRIQPNQCLYCNGFGHWSVNCPLKKKSQPFAIGKPTSTQTGPSTDNQRT
ncbi:uncharacterized protein LOC133194331 [Saccostrea echinata]|uniref:uncharacterized protein LOC133194331 n=1 Tax=Saccostrea echinata TaxID=191078 RepID=UPI002A800397|nr:uncharacterized protein LOC133194331 [Saccostrea echinata]